MIGTGRSKVRVFSKNIAFSARMIVCFCWIAVSILSQAQCKPAQTEDVTHGANMLIELKEQKLNHVFGTVSFLGGDWANDIVVEVYRREGTESLQEARQKPRLAACVTSNDGQFSFAGLKPGRYLVLAGTRKEAGVNEIYVPIILKRSWLGSRGSGIRFVLTLGT
jgi:hypothetical protein